MLLFSSYCFIAAVYALLYALHSMAYKRAMPSVFTLILAVMSIGMGVILLIV